jgi:hypothetical protein
MNQRNVDLEKMRGETFGLISDQSTLEETFQNQVLRPILKLQNELILAIFQNYMQTNKINLQAHAIENQRLIIANSIQKDLQFNNVLKGLVIGLFTIEEYEVYIQHTTAINKRIIQLIIERIYSQISFFATI